MLAEKLDPALAPRRSTSVVYPDSDGQRMADNTLQFDWIVLIKENLDASVPDFVGGDLLWYPVEGDPKTRVAPDALVAIGRPKGYRGSYKQWEEGGIPPQVVFEILSPGNRPMEMFRKQTFYERHGVQEYYVIDPDEPSVMGYIRNADRLVSVAEMNGFVSPILGIRFETTGDKLVVRHRDGTPFTTRAEERASASAERQRAEAEKQRAEAEKQRAEAEKQRAEAEKQRADALAAKLRAAGIDPDA